MEGFNPNQSLIPAVGGNITPMSGGGYTDAGGSFREFGLTQAEFNLNRVVYEPIIKKLLPSITADIQTLFNSRGSDETPTNDQIITEILSSVGKMNKNDIQILVQSKNKEFVITELIIPDILAGYKTQIDSDKIQVYFDETGLVIDINNDMKVSSTSGPAVPTPVIIPANVTTLPARSTNVNLSSSRVSALSGGPPSNSSSTSSLTSSSAAPPSGIPSGNSSSSSLVGSSSDAQGYMLASKPTISTSP